MDRRWGWYALISGLFIAVPGALLAFWFLNLHGIPSLLYWEFDQLKGYSLRALVEEGATRLGYPLLESFLLLFKDSGFLESFGLFLIGAIIATVGIIRLMRQSEEPEATDKTNNNA